jgi:hypothetical protein
MKSAHLAFELPNARVASTVSAPEVSGSRRLFNYGQFAPARRTILGCIRPDAPLTRPVD